MSHAGDIPNYKKRDFDQEDKDKKKDSSKNNKESEDLKVYPIIMEEDKNNQGDPEKYYPLSPEVHLHLIIGRVKAGKSVLLNNLYMSNRFFADAFKVRILISSTAVNDPFIKRF